MADDLNLTPANSRTAAPGAEPTGNEPTTAEIAALPVTDPDADGEDDAVTPTPTAPAGPVTTDGPSAAAAAMAAEPPLAATAPAPPPKVSNETPTITRPAPRPAPTPRPAPAPTSSAPLPGATPPPRPSTSPVPAPARPQADWAAEVADRIDEVVAKVRANTSDRLVGVARMVVFGLLAAVMGITALVLVMILFFRLLAIIPGPVWIPYLGLGAIFLAFGWFCYSKRTAKSSPA